MREFLIYLIPVAIGAIVLRFFGKQRQKKQTELLDMTAQKTGWTKASHESTMLLQTLRDFRLFRRGTRTKITNLLCINDKERLFHLEHGSMNDGITYNYIAFLCTIKNQSHLGFNICLKHHNLARHVPLVRHLPENRLPENHTVIQSDQLGSLNTQYDVESRTSDVSHLLNLLTPHAISAFEAIGVGDERPEMEVNGQYLLIYRPQISGESSKTIEQFVQLAQDFSKHARLI